MIDQAIQFLMFKLANYFLLLLFLILFDCNLLLQRLLSIFNVNGLLKFNILT